jgi:hypothetical protein
VKIALEIDVPPSDHQDGIIDTLIGLFKMIGSSAVSANCAVALTLDGGPLEE